MIREIVFGAVFGVAVVVSNFSIEIKREAIIEKGEKVILITYQNDVDFKESRKIYGERSPYRSVIDTFVKGNKNNLEKAEYSGVIFQDESLDSIKYISLKMYFDEQQPEDIVWQEIKLTTLDGKKTTTQFKENSKKGYYQKETIFDSKNERVSEIYFYRENRDPNQYKTRKYIYKNSIIIESIEEFYPSNTQALSSAHYFFDPPLYLESEKYPKKTISVYKNNSKGALKSTLYNLKGLGYLKSTEYDPAFDKSKVARIDVIVSVDGTTYVTDVYYDKEIKPGFFTEWYSLKSDGTYETFYFKKGEVPTPKIEFPSD